MAAPLASGASVFSAANQLLRFEGNSFHGLLCATQHEVAALIARSATGPQGGSRSRGAADAARLWRLLATEGKWSTVGPLCSAPPAANTIVCDVGRRRLARAYSTLPRFHQSCGNRRRVGRVYCPSRLIAGHRLLNRALVAARASRPWPSCGAQMVAAWIDTPAITTWRSNAPGCAAKWLSN